MLAERDAEHDAPSGLADALEVVLRDHIRYPKEAKDFSAILGHRWKLTGL